MTVLLYNPEPTATATRHASVTSHWLKGCLNTIHPLRSYFRHLDITELPATCATPSKRERRLACVMWKMGRQMRRNLFALEMLPAIPIFHIPCPRLTFSTTAPPPRLFGRLDRCGRCVCWTALRLVCVWCCGSRLRLPKVSRVPRRINQSAALFRACLLGFSRGRRRSRWLISLVSFLKSQRVWSLVGLLARSLCCCATFR